MIYKCGLRPKNNRGAANEGKLTREKKMCMCAPVHASLWTRSRSFGSRLIAIDDDGVSVVVEGMSRGSVVVVEEAGGGGGCDSDEEEEDDGELLSIAVCSNVTVFKYLFNRGVEGVVVAVAAAVAALAIAVVVVEVVVAGGLRLMKSWSGAFVSVSDNCDDCVDKVGGNDDDGNDDDEDEKEEEDDSLCMSKLFGSPFCLGCCCCCCCLLCCCCRGFC